MGLPPHVRGGGLLIGHESPHYGCHHGAATEVALLRELTCTWATLHELAVLTHRGTAEMMRQTPEASAGRRLLS